MGLSIADVTEIIAVQFPQSRDAIGAFEIVALPPLGARVRLPIDERFTRPGGSVSGPTMFNLADLSVYVALIAHQGSAAVDAVTSTMTINFLARPELADLFCEASLLRVGRRQAVAEARLWTDGNSDLVAHATAAYAMPQRNADK